MDDELKAPRKKGRGAAALQDELLAAISGLSARIDAMEERLVNASSASAYSEPLYEPSFEEAPTALSSEEVENIFGGLPQPDQLEELEPLSDEASAPVSNVFDNLPEFIEPEASVVGEGYALDESHHEIGETLEEASGAGMMSDAEISALFAQADALDPAVEPDRETMPEAPTPEKSKSALTPDEVAALLAGEVPEGAEDLLAGADHKPAIDPGVVPMSDEEIAALMAEPEPESGQKVFVAEYEAPAETPEGGWELDRSLAEKAPLELAVAALAVPIELQPGKMICLVAEPCDFEALGRLSKAVGVFIETKEADMEDIVRLLRDLYGDQAKERSVGACAKLTSHLIQKFGRAS